ncbi:MAG: hypothetical protein RIT45_1955 [Pseudomonadota bacterium]
MRRSTRPLPSLATAVFALLGALLVAAPASALDRKAGPIWSLRDAGRTCPKVCGPGERWNGQWRTVKPHKMSVCGCEPIAPPMPVMPGPPPALPAQITPPPAPPGAGIPMPRTVVIPRVRKAKKIQRRCARACVAAGFGPYTGHHWTGPGRRQTSCQCQAIAPRPTPRVIPAPPAPAAPAVQKFVREAGPLWNQQNASQTCPGVCAAAQSRWNGQWWTTQSGKMSVCECERTLVAPAPAPQPTGPGVVVQQPGGNLPPAARPGTLGPLGKPLPPGAIAPRPGFDGCEAPNQPCVCGNTQRPGRCGAGPHKPGLYCRCD